MNRIFSGKNPMRLSAPVAVLLLLLLVCCPFRPGAGRVASFLCPDALAAGSAELDLIRGPDGVWMPAVGRTALPWHTGFRQTESVFRSAGVRLNRSGNDGGLYYTSGSPLSFGGFFLDSLSVYFEPDDYDDPGNDLTLMRYTSSYSYDSESARLSNAVRQLGDALVSRCGQPTRIEVSTDRKYEELSASTAPAAALSRLYTLIDTYGDSWGSLIVSFKNVDLEAEYSGGRFTLRFQLCFY